MTQSASSRLPRFSADWVKGAVALTLLVCILISSIGAGAGAAMTVLSYVAIGAAVLLTALCFPKLNAIARGFLLAAVVFTVLTMVFAPGNGAKLLNAATQGAIFAAFLVSLGLMRGPARRSHLVRAAARYLFTLPERFVRPSVGFGVQFISVLFNLGTITIVADAARDHAQAERQAGRQAINPDDVILLVHQGAIMGTIWNPVGIGFAIVTTAIVGLSPVVFLITSFVAAMLVSCALFLRIKRGDEGPQLPKAAAEIRQGKRAVAILAAIIAVIITVSVLLHSVLHISFLLSAAMILPVVVMVWPFIEHSVRMSEKTSVVAHLGVASQSTSYEGAVFLAAGLISAGVAAFLGKVTGGVDWISLAPAWSVILAAMVLVPFLAMTLIPHSVVMVMLAQMLGPTLLGVEHPTSLALALCFSWALAISISPISAMTLITSGLLKTSPPRLVFQRNKAFSIWLLLGATLMVLGVYGVEGALALR